MHARNAVIDPYPLTELCRRNARRNTPTVVTWWQQVPDADPVRRFTAGPGRAFLWSDGERRLLAVGAGADLPGHGTGRFDAVRAGVRRLLDGAQVGGDPPAGMGAGPPLVGGFAFAPRRPSTPGPTDAIPPLPDALLWLPAAVLVRDRDGCRLGVSAVLRDGDDPAAVAATAVATAGPLLADPAPAPRPGRPAGWETTHLPAESVWRGQVADAVREITRGRFAKVVLARVLRVRADAPFDPPAVVRALVRGEPAATVFAVRLHGQCFLGATPERLARVDAGGAETMSLAGSAGRGADNAFGSDPKIRHEHALVTEAVRAALRPFCREVLAPDRPVVLDLATVRHLLTRIRGVLAEPDRTGVLDLVAALHPTPAVGGTPRAAAVDWLGRTEAVDRSWYAGPVGWCCGNDGDFAVAIRSARIAGPVADLYAGNGIVAASGPDDEVAETWWKLRVMLGALGGPAVAAWLP